VAGDGGRRYHVEGIYAGRHGDADGLVRLAEPAGGESVAFGAEHEGGAAGRCHAGDRGRGLVGSQRQQAEASRPELGQAVVPGGHPRVGNGENRPHRDLDRPAVERVGAARGQDHRIQAEGGGAAEDRADVGVIYQVLQYQDAARRRGQVGYGGQLLAVKRGKRAAVHAVAGEALGALVGDHVDRGVTGREGGQVRAPGLGDQDRAKRIAGRDGAGDYLGAFGYEQAVG
jgi:hypothetical protein